MKVIAQKPSIFAPFSILIESQGEADYFASLVGNSHGGIYSLFGIDPKSVDKLYNELSSRAMDEQTFDIEVSSHI
jgi:hypothetical protein